MVVDFVLKRAPSYRIATLSRPGPWKPEILKKEFRELGEWTKREGIRTGRWFFLHRPGPKETFVAGVEVKGRVRPIGKVRLRTLRASAVAAVTFDPDRLSSRVVYHGLSDWLRWRKREGKIRRVLSSREVYRADPWKDPRAWARCEVQFVVAS